MARKLERGSLVEILSGFYIHRTAIYLEKSRNGRHSVQLNCFSTIIPTRLLLERSQFRPVAEGKASLQRPNVSARAKECSQSEP